MNRTLYKVVFNKHRNCMMAVAENAKREGKNTADTQAETFAKFLSPKQPKPKQRFSAVFISNIH